MARRHTPKDVVTGKTTISPCKKEQTNGQLSRRVVNYTYVKKKFRESRIGTKNKLRKLLLPEVRGGLMAKYRDRPSRSSVVSMLSMAQGLEIR